MFNLDRTFLTITLHKSTTTFLRYLSVTAHNIYLGYHGYLRRVLRDDVIAQPDAQPAQRSFTPDNT